MDLQLKQWRRQQQHQNESEDQASAAMMSKNVLDQSQTATSAPLPLFAPEPSSFKLPSLPEFYSDFSLRFNKMGSYFSWAQWQELELQALIYRYMLAGTCVPQELLFPLKKSLLHRSPSYILHHPFHHFPHYQPALSWGKAAMDPEPGRCRRTDGKKWRCSRDVVVGHKYCERHMHRGRNRSRKPVETPASKATAAMAGTVGGAGREEMGVVGDGKSIFFSDSLLSSELLTNSQSNKKSDGGRILRHFLDDSDRTATCLSISMPGHWSSDFSLKLSTGNGEVNRSNNNKAADENNMGPLAEALTTSSSAATSTWLSPSGTRVLPQLGIATQAFY